MMSLILCAALMQAAVLAADPVAAEKPQAAVVAKETTIPAEPAKKVEADDEESYTQAHEVTLKTGKPLVVMVGADWCGPCQNMRRSILPRVREHGLFRKVTFAHVNVDKDRDLAKQLTEGNSVPQLVMYRKTKDGWARRIMVGAHSVEEVEKFINEGLPADADDAQASKESPTSHSTTSTAQADDEKQHG
jgi:thioredoxin-like negative regulator of GroEL